MISLNTPDYSQHCQRPESYQQSSQEPQQYSTYSSPYLQPRQCQPPQTQQRQRHTNHTRTTTPYYDRYSEQYQQQQQPTSSPQRQLSTAHLHQFAYQPRPQSQAETGSSHHHHQYYPRQHRPSLLYPPVRTLLSQSNDPLAFLALYSMSSSDRRAHSRSEGSSTISSTGSPPSNEMSISAAGGCDGGGGGGGCGGSSDNAQQQTPTEASIAQALEIARESEDGASDQVISNILESGLTAVYNKVAAQPETYVLTRVEFSLWNYFQHRFIHDPRLEPLYRSAKARYWNSASGAS